MMSLMWLWMPVVVLALCTSGRAAENPIWPQFRGPQALGTVENPRLPDRWSEAESVPPLPRHLTNSYASETRVTDGERVYAVNDNDSLIIRTAAHLYRIGG